MAVQQPNPAAQLQRIQLEVERGRPDRRVKIRVENYDESLGWYTSGSLSLGLHQLPLLEQAVEAMKSGAPCEETFDAKIIPFPGLARESLGQVR